jgi:hypothetical protein
MVPNRLQGVHFIGDGGVQARCATSANQGRFPKETFMAVAPPAAYSEVGTITPFWQRIPKFFLFPFHLDPLMYAAFLALMSLLIRIMPNFIGVIVALGIALATLRYGFRIVEQTSLGFLSPDQYQRDAALQTTYLPYKMFGVLILWGLVQGFASRFSPTLGFFLGIFTTLALPAVVMVLVITGSFLQGINPAQWMKVMSAVGSPYLALWFFLFLLLSGAGIALRFLAPILGGWLAIPVITFAYVYFTFVMANMTGYVLYQFHHALGLTVEVGFDVTGAGETKTVKAADPIGDDIARHVASGNLKDALELAREQQEVEPDNLLAHERYHKLLGLAGKNDELLRHGTRYIGALLRKDQHYRALEVLKLLRNVEPKFESTNPAHTLPLARAARGRGEHSYAMSLMRGFDQKHPRDQDVPSIYLLSAQILSEHFHKNDLARLLLRQLIAKHPGSPAATEARVYLQTMERIAGTSQAPSTPAPPGAA